MDTFGSNKGMILFAISKPFRIRKSYIGLLFFGLTALIIYSGITLAAYYLLGGDLESIKDNETSYRIFRVQAVIFLFIDYFYEYFWILAISSFTYLSFKYDDITSKGLFMDIMTQAKKNILLITAFALLNLIAKSIVDLSNEQWVIILFENFLEVFFTVVFVLVYIFFVEQSYGLRTSINRVLNFLNTGKWGVIIFLYLVSYLYHKTVHLIIELSVKLSLRPTPGPVPGSMEDQYLTLTLTSVGTDIAISITQLMVLIVLASAAKFSIENKKAAGKSGLP